MSAGSSRARRRAAPARDRRVAVMVRAVGWRRAVPGAVALCRRAVEAARIAAGMPDEDGEIAVVLADDRMVRRLNRAWRGKDAPTNVLAFPADDAGQPVADPDEVRLLGDVVVALGTTRREARMEEKKLSDHLAHLVVHGTLHLLGHDHQSNREAARMEALEIAALARLGIADPYAAAHKVEARRR